MEPKNKYYRHAHISERKFRQLVHYFTLDLSAADVAQLTNLTRKTANTIFLKIRQRLAEECDRSSSLPASELQLVMEDYLRRGASEANHAKGKGELRATQRLMKSTPGLASPAEMEDFRHFARKRLQKFYGVSGHTLYLHLKECEWRYNMRHEDLNAELLKLLRAHPL
ncbi:MAG: hypothetical protein JO316_12910 [Abitibacteriaceae bacterium]|nr:hypothetical protein [Abditibacteriaceae bacterium]MBV9866246.1 hypothetical protein [Abditibacteriaceae bacterium]